MITDCDIRISLQSKLFDHKAIFLDFNAKPVLASQPTISTKILIDPDLDIVVKLACYECYCQNLLQNNADKDNLLLCIGRCHELLRNAGPDPEVPH